MLARDQRLVAHIIKIERIGAIAARDFQHVAEALRGHQRRMAAFALNDGVDNERGTVIDQPDIGRGHLGLTHAIGDAFDEIVVGRRTFGIEHTAGFMIEGHEIGEGAADIDGDDIGHTARLLPSPYW